MLVTSKKFQATLTEVYNDIDKIQKYVYKRMELLESQMTVMNEVMRELTNLKLKEIKASKAKAKKKTKAKAGKK